MNHAELLETLNCTADELISVCWSHGGQFTSMVVRATDAHTAVASVSGDPHGTNVWFSVNPVTGPARVGGGRGTAEDVTRLAALWCDLDVKPGACRNLEHAHEIIDVLAQLLGTRPSAVVMSGHGLQPYWPIEDGELPDAQTRARAAALLKRWGRLAVMVAQSLGGAKIDRGVYDLPRILRVPGTFNCKTEPVLVTAEADTGAPVSLEELEERLDEAGVKEYDGDATIGGPVHSAPDGWGYAPATCQYMAKTIEAWRTEPIAERHPWLVGHVVRLQAALRKGCLTAEDYAAARKVITDRFLEACAATGRTVPTFEVTNAFTWATEQVSRKTDAELARELGKHKHPDETDASLYRLAGNRPDNAPSREPRAGEQKTRGNVITKSTAQTAEHSGQVRMAYRLADGYKNRLLYAHGLGWHHWDKRRWAPDDRGMAQRAVIDVIRLALAVSVSDKELRSDVRKCESANGIAGVLAIAAALPTFAATVADLDADPYLLNCANGTLDLRTMKLSAHDPADRITKVTRAAYDPQAPAPTWAAFLAKVLPDGPPREYLQRITGVALLGRVVEHVLAILTGSGANGKGTFYKAMLWALGDYASTVEPDLLMHRHGAHPTGEMDLLGRRLVVVSESERDRRLAEATMKRLTGGDSIRARRMRQDFIEFEPSHTPLLITNHLPKVSGDDPAIWRRLRVVPFTVEIPAAERDPHLDEKLQAEADAVLAWAVAGWADYRRSGLAEPKAVLVATEAYQKASDAVARFIDDMCTTDAPTLKATTQKLHDAWVKWQAADGGEPLGLRAFGQALEAKGYPAKKSNGTRWREGISLRVPLSDSAAA